MVVDDRFNQDKQLGQIVLLIYSVYTETADVVDNKPSMEDVSDSLKIEKEMWKDRERCRILCHNLNLENHDRSILNTLFQYNRHLFHWYWYVLVMVSSCLC